MSAHAYNHQKTTKPFYLYRAYNSRGRLLYIGITTCLERRSREHGEWWRKSVKRVDSRLIGPRAVAQAAEVVAIRNEDPVRNQLRAGCWSTVNSTLAAYMRSEGLCVAALAEKVNATEEEVQAWLAPYAVPNA